MMLRTLILIAICYLISILSPLSAQGYSLKVDLNCIASSERGEDEVYILVKSDSSRQWQRFPRRGARDMDEGGSKARWRPAISFNYSNSIRVRVMEYDNAGKDDHLGDVVLSGGRAVKRRITGDGSRYDVTLTPTRRRKVVQAAQKPFRVVFSGLHCLNTEDNGEDEVYLKVWADGKLMTYGPRAMNEAGNGTQNFFDQLVGVRKKEFWLGGYNWKINRDFRIEVWDKDGPDPDDRIGTLVINQNTPFQDVVREFNREGHYVLRVSKRPLLPPTPGIPSSYSLRGKTITEAVGNQGSEGACVAWATTAALGTRLVRDYVQNTGPFRMNGSPGKIKLGDLGRLKRNLFNAQAFYRQRQNTRQEGWNYSGALRKAGEVTLPLAGFPNHGVRVISFDEIMSNGEVYRTQNGRRRKVRNAPLGEIPGSEMRRALARRDPLMARFDVYNDFTAYVGTTGIYCGNITNQGGRDDGRPGGHAVMVLGYNQPTRNQVGLPFWEVQNSWGTQWGRKGYCMMATGSVGIDRSMFRINSYVLCDRNGRAVAAPQARGMLERAMGHNVSSPGRLVSRAPKRSGFSVSIPSIRCLDTTEGGEDEVYLKVYVDGKSAGRIPHGSYHSMNEGTSKAVWRPTNVWNARAQVIIEIWELDDSSKDDLIGRATFRLHSPKGSVVKRFRNGCKYDVVFRKN